MINEGTFSEAHRMILTTYYEDTKRPTKEEIYSIADSLNRKPVSIRKWFQRMRTKNRASKNEKITQKTSGIYSENRRLIIVINVKPCKNTLS